MKKIIADAYAQYAEFGASDILLTMTANLDWDEILDVLSYYNGEDGYYRGDIVTRVFRLKLMEPYCFIFLFLGHAIALRVLL